MHIGRVEVIKLKLEVSIRSPYRSKGRCEIGESQSHNRCYSFNPLPLPKQGEIKENGIQTIQAERR